MWYRISSQFINRAFSGSTFLSLSLSRSLPSSLLLHTRSLLAASHRDIMWPLCVINNNNKKTNSFHGRSSPSTEWISPSSSSSFHFLPLSVVLPTVSVCNIFSFASQDAEQREERKNTNFFVNKNTATHTRTHTTDDDGTELSAPVLLSIHFVSFHFDKLPVEWFIAYTQTLDRLHSQPHPNNSVQRSGECSYLFTHTRTDTQDIQPNSEETLLWLTDIRHDFFFFIFFNSLLGSSHHAVVAAEEHFKFPHEKVWLKCNEIGLEIKRAMRLKEIIFGVKACMWHIREIRRAKCILYWLIESNQDTRHNRIWENDYIFSFSREFGCTEMGPAGSNCHELQ